MKVELLGYMYRAEIQISSQMYLDIYEIWNNAIRHVFVCVCVPFCTCIRARTHTFMLIMLHSSYFASISFFKKFNLLLAWAVILNTWSQSKVHIQKDKIKHKFRDVHISSLALEKIFPNSSLTNAFLPPQEKKVIKKKHQSTKEIKCSSQSPWCLGKWIKNRGPRYYNNLLS